MAPRVPNYNALSSLLDRLAIENIKLSFFENALEYDDLSPDETKEFERKSEAQRAMIDVLKTDTVSVMEEAFINGEYDFIAEGRTYS